MRMKCGCKIDKAGEPPDLTECSGINGQTLGRYVHTEPRYPCLRTQCLDYRPSRLPLHDTDWPRCVCGEIAQEHG